MKDAKGHGSNTRGGMTPVQSENAPFVSRFKKGSNFLDPNDPRAKGTHSALIDNLPAKMQRRHFEAIASELRGQADAGSPEHRERVNEIANKLSTTNPGFRRDFFMAAAIPGEGKYNNKSSGRNSNMGGVRKAIAKMRG